MYVRTALRVFVAGALKHVLNMFTLKCKCGSGNFVWLWKLCVALVTLRGSVLQLTLYARFVTLNLALNIAVNRTAQTCLPLLLLNA